MAAESGKGFYASSHPFSLIRKRKDQEPTGTAKESPGQLCISKASETGTGFRFDKLPTELRHLCWDWAARLEAADMMIFVRVDHVIYPTKKLISPLLSVNRESRGCALKVYNLSLEIHEGEEWEQVRRREWNAQQRSKSASTQSSSESRLGRPERQAVEKPRQELAVLSGHDAISSGSSDENSSKYNDTESSSTTLDDNTKVGKPLIRVNLELSTMICQYWIRQYTRRPANQSLSGLEKTRYFPTSPGPWRLGATPVSRMLSLPERSKVRRRVLVRLNDSPGQKWQSWMKNHHPEGPAEVSRSFYPGIQTLFFLTLGLQNGPTTVLHDLNEMGWNQFRQKMGNRIIEWTSDEDSDKEEKQDADEKGEKQQDANQEDEA